MRGATIKITNTKVYNCTQFHTAYDKLIYNLLFPFFWVIPWRLNFICRRFGTHCIFHLHRRVGKKNSSYLPVYEDGPDRVFRNVGI